MKRQNELKFTPHPKSYPAPPRYQASNYSRGFRGRGRGRGRGSSVRRGRRGRGEGSLLVDITIAWCVNACMQFYPLIYDVTIGVSLHELAHKLKTSVPMFRSAIAPDHEHRSCSSSTFIDMQLIILYWLV